MPAIPIPPIKLPDDVVKRIQPPICIKIPKPEPFSVCLPFGGALQAIENTTAKIPDDCSLSFSILLQLPPLMASLGCFVKILKLLKPLIDVIGGITGPDPGKLAGALPEFVEAGVDVVSCFTGMVTNIPKFIRDVLLLIAKLLKCVAQQIKSIAELMGGLQISIQTAQAAGNKKLLEQLQCAQDNAKAQADAAMGTMDMIAVVLALIEPLLSLAPGVPSISLPALGSAEDIEGIEQAANTMLTIAASLEQIANVLKPLGTC